MSMKIFPIVELKVIENKLKPKAIDIKFLSFDMSSRLNFKVRLISTHESTNDAKWHQTHDLLCKKQPKDILSTIFRTWHNSGYLLLEGFIFSLAPFRIRCTMSKKAILSCVYIWNSQKEPKNMETRKIPLSRHIAFDVLWSFFFLSAYMRES